MMLKKNLSMLIVIFVLVFLFVFYENYRVKKEVRLVWEFWTNAISHARQQNSTTQDFYTQYRSQGKLKSDDTLPNPALVQSVRLSGVLCSEYSFRIYYSSGGDDGANLVFLSGKGHGLLCFI